MSEIMVQFDHVTKEFPGVKALNDVSFSIKRGELHALVGENGAGKSTLLNVLHGVYVPSGGRIVIDDTHVEFHAPIDALRFGISKVHQEINVVDVLSVEQNIVLGAEPLKGPAIDFRKMYREVDDILEKLGCQFRAADPIRGLSVGELQMIAIAKAIYHKAKVISFDEPTASLSDKEIEILFEKIEELKAQGLTIIYVSHKLDEIFRLADRISVLRDGQYVDTFQASDISRDELIRNMVGRDVSNYAQRVKPLCATDEVLLSVEGLCGEGFQNISFTLRRGEILGVSGLVGAKRTEIMRALFGVDRRTAGTIRFKGEEAVIHSPKQALKVGVGLVSENRKTEGFVKYMSNRQNMTLAALPNFCRAGGVMKRLDIAKNFEEYAKKVRLNITNPDHLTENLSGGNQQKVILAKWLMTNVEVIIFDEPTKGVDVGAKQEIYALMEEFVAQGNAIIMVSSELTEVIGMSDRALVVRDGEISACLNREELSEETLLKYAMPERSA